MENETNIGPIMFAQEQMMSPDIGKLSLALSKAQGVFTGATKDKNNPFFKTNYADLGSIQEAAREGLTTNELAVTQVTRKAGAITELVTMLSHSSGQWIRGVMDVTPVKKDPQGFGSAHTYARRQSYAAIVGIAQVDDDGGAAAGTSVKTITDDRQLKINELISEHGLDLAVFSKWLDTKGIKAIADIPVDSYRSIIAKLNESIEAKKHT